MTSKSKIGFVQLQKVRMEPILYHTSQRKLSAPILNFGSVESFDAFLVYSTIYLGEEKQFYVWNREDTISQGKKISLILYRLYSAIGSEFSELLENAHSLRIWIHTLLVSS